MTFQPQNPKYITFMFDMLIINIYIQKVFEITNYLNVSAHLLKHTPPYSHLNEH